MKKLIVLLFILSLYSCTAQNFICNEHTATTVDTSSYTLVEKHDCSRTEKATIGTILRSVGISAAAIPYGSLQYNNAGVLGGTPIGYSELFTNPLLTVDTLKSLIIRDHESHSYLTIAPAGIAITGNAVYLHSGAFTDTVPSESGTVALKHYKEYSVLISQAGNAAPTIASQWNDLGAIVWTYVSAGKYNGALTGAFDANKTTFIVTLNLGANSIPASGVHSTVLNSSVVDVNNIQIQTFYDGTATDGLLDHATFIVREKL